MEMIVFIFDYKKNDFDDPKNIFLITQPGKEQCINTAKYWIEKRLLHMHIIRAYIIHEEIKDAINWGNEISDRLLDEKHKEQKESRRQIYLTLKREFEDE